MNRICRFKKLSLLTVLASLLGCVVAKASLVSIQWTPNTDPSVAGYNVYYGGSSRNYTNVLSTANNSSAVTVGGLVEGQTYYFAVTAFDAFGDESDLSDEAQFIVPGFLTLAPSATPGGTAHIQFPVTQGHWYELQASKDLVSWTTIWQVTGVINTWVQFDAPSTGSGSQFYRVVLH